MDISEIKAPLEAVLFASGEAIPVKRLAALLDCGEDEVVSAAYSIRDELAFGRRGVRLVEMNDMFQLVSAPEHSDVVRRALETRRPPQLSAAALETLAIIAYHQPITKTYVEQLRGVDSSYTVSVLQDRGLIEEAGRLPVPGRPILYRTTPVFLRSFGITSLDELPELPENAEPDEMQLQAQELMELIAAGSGEEKAE